LGAEPPAVLHLASLEEMKTQGNKPDQAWRTQANGLEMGA